MVDDFLKKSYSFLSNTVLFQFSEITMLLFWNDYKIRTNVANGTEKSL